MTEHLTDVKALTDEQSDRAIAMAEQMRADYWGLYSAARVIVHLQDALRGISTCSTCEACRGAALRALGGEKKLGYPTDKATARERLRQWAPTVECPEKPPGDG